MRGANFARELANGSAELSAPVNVTHIVPPLLAQVEDVDQDRKRQRKWHIERGHQLLDQLEILQKKLVIGDLGRDDLFYIVKVLKENKKTLNEPNLMNLIEEIEIRAMVELAKLGLHI